MKPFERLFRSNESIEREERIFIERVKELIIAGDAQEISGVIIDKFAPRQNPLDPRLKQGFTLFFKALKEVADKKDFTDYESAPSFASLLYSQDATPKEKFIREWKFGVGSTFIADTMLAEAFAQVFPEYTEG